MQKLKAQLSGTEAGPLDLAKAARLLTDIQAVAGQADLSGLTVVEEDRAFIAAAGVRVREQAQARTSVFLIFFLPLVSFFCENALSGKNFLSYRCLHV